MLLAKENFEKNMVFIEKNAKQIMAFEHFDASGDDDAQKKSGKKKGKGKYKQDTPLDEIPDPSGLFANMKERLDYFRMHKVG